MTATQVEVQRPTAELTLVVPVSGQPFAFGAAGRADDAHRVPALYGQVVLAHLPGHHHLGVVHGFLFTRHLA